MAYSQIAVDGHYRRLIPSKYPTIDIYEKFGSSEMQALAAKLETITNPRLAAKSRITGGDISADSSSPKLQHWNHAPFSYPMAEGTYFLPAPYSVLELASDERGALAKAILRREEFLSRTDEPVCGVDMRMITNKVSGSFVDLRGLPHETTQAARRMLGQRLYEDGVDGVIFKITDLSGSEFISIFNGDCLVDKGVQGAHYRFRWDGQRIGRIYDFGNKRDIDRGEIIAVPMAAA
ncbi:RES family NAD+ phosphorylase [Rhizobium indigoferae]|uniref:RES family NAD+ phosphorylase n=1 Tax=Rhizobium indigoferae TaxID=158891 RepID=A0ABZ1DVJ5_9HYPH|nr:RES family NAD+ phosphorylase [Rhizobium indigoferae]NNU55578.1 RES family NAD+ phosphorylase [Rhizobium indigoferae]WRW39428.1 RES family NAD+ phosphorylase [Rhizobium indigoferae]